MKWVIYPFIHLTLSIFRRKIFGLSKKTYYSQDRNVDLTKRLETTKKIDTGGKQGIVIATRHTTKFAPKNEQYPD